MAVPNEDTLELGGQSVGEGRLRGEQPAAKPRARRFLSILFRCCHVYGRLYRNAEQTAYTGRCPRCGAGVQARIGPEGTSRRVFDAL
jgi:hypothetical protein